MEKYDVVIIGGGPSGLTAAVYTSRANLSTLFIEKGAPGGKMVKTHKIENWPGEKSISGPDLSLKMFDHSKQFGAKYKYGDVVKIKNYGDQDHTVVLASGEEIKAKAVIIATGMLEKVPADVENIQRFENRGVSYCAICDGPLYKGGDTIVIGGGNSAIEEAGYLSSVAKSVKVFVRNKISAEQKLVDELLEKKNVEIYLGSKVLKLEGETRVEKALVSIEGKEQTINVDAVFPYIGQAPVTTFAKELGITNEFGFIRTDSHMETNVKGIFAIGDVREKEIRQIATAASDGAIAGKVIANRL